MKIYQILILVTILLTFLVYSLNYLLFLERIKKVNTDNLLIKNNTINFSSLTLKQKIAQMIFVRGDYESNKPLTNLNIGGVFLDKQKSEETYKDMINIFQNNSKIKLFVATDLEGAWNPFASFKNLPPVSDIRSRKESYELGLEHGKLLKELGFNMNFAPVAEFEDKSYGGRAFTGNKSEIKEKLKGYIKGLQKNVLGTCKHYPGNGMINNLHIRIDRQNISKDDLSLFNACFDENVSAVMIGHQIATGEIDSERVPSSVSENVMKSLGNFSGLIISDEINMRGLKNFYYDKSLLYRDLINSGINVILDFQLDPKTAYNLINEIEEQVEDGKIDKGKIDESVKKILKSKGYKIK